MIKALESGPDGLCMVFGLTWVNLDKLADNMPIRLRSEEVGVRPGFDVWILGGPTLGAIGEDLRSVGMRVPDDPDVVDEGLLRFFTHWKARGRVLGSELPVQVVGITAAAARRLRAGGGYRWPIAERRNLFARVCAGPDTDAIGRQITAGRPVQQFVDLRGGRTD